ncbi:uncharacterized protein LOC129965665 [Argiope bruennichi]|uniref:uncharacterized protein LOC129965665 n=1 Tax=Argiope bruennichi TaxID=94029 RepID=UPI002494BC86|nr:uncharacterized protein LOC129965665 [Argiope bruennichi]
MKNQYDAALPEQDSEIAEFEAKYLETKVIYQSAIEALNGVAPTVNPTPVGTNFKLPRLNIPSFNGKYTDWLNFKDLYLATVHNNHSLANIQKFQYLIGLLNDEPANIIKHIPISETTYVEAWSKLLSRYDRKNQIVTSVRKFLEQPSVTNPNSVNLGKLADTSDEVIRGLKSLGEKASSKDVWLIHLLLEKVDSETHIYGHKRLAKRNFLHLNPFGSS